MLTTPSKAITLPPSSSATPSSSCSSLSIHQEHQEEGDMLLRRVVASNFVGNGTPPPSPSNSSESKKKNKTRKFTFNVMDSPAESFSSSDGLSSSQRLDKLRSLSISMEQDKVQEVERLIVDHSPKGTNTQPKSKSCPADYVVSFDMGESQGVVSSHVLDPLEHGFVHNNEKRKELAEKLLLKSQGLHFKPISKFFKSHKGVREESLYKHSQPSQETLKNGEIIGGGVNDVLSKTIEEEIQENECCNYEELLRKGFYLYLGVTADLSILKNTFLKEIPDDSCMKLDNQECVEPFRLNIALSIDYEFRTSYFSVVSHDSFLVKGFVETLSSFPTNTNEQLKFIENAFEKDEYNNMKMKRLFSMKRQDFPPSQFVSCDNDIERSILHFGTVHGQTAECVFERKNNQERWPFSESINRVRAVLICNDNLSNQYISRGMWQLIHLFEIEDILDSEVQAPLSSVREEKSMNAPEMGTQTTEEIILGESCSEDLQDVSNASPHHLDPMIEKEVHKETTSDQSALQESEKTDLLLKNAMCDQTTVENHTDTFDLQSTLELVPYNIDCFSENLDQNSKEEPTTDNETSFIPTEEKHLEMPVSPPPLMIANKEDEQNEEDSIEVLSKENVPEIISRRTGDSFDVDRSDQKEESFEVGISKDKNEQAEDRVESPHPTSNSQKQHKAPIKKKKGNRRYVKHPTLFK
ncbi:hypothetical protein FDP41_009569 [Naegleria fowleri]|uniref:Uncharacterized protein n=1 Tax=Naegleria fowleri TaxID=5763 RepID=A0A6A5BBL8_NAEFO|nr:uncharacterized protein FDP41_009569 [Naegleria fowleri]KAF0972161.1 hypothetical protein FDP41_009569 [Naegleria fowleri]